MYSPYSEKVAQSWYQKACDLNNDSGLGCTSIAYRVLRGTAGHPQDVNRAIDYLRRRVRENQHTEPV